MRPEALAHLRDDDFSNEELTVKEKDVVDLVVYRKTDIGYVVIINEVHLGMLHFNEVFRHLEPGDELTGFIKKIKEDNKIDVVPGKPGHTRVEGVSVDILELLERNKGFLPYHDKTDPEVIYRVFGMSKKTFKMTIGNLYREKKILISDKGIQLVEKPAG
jgi:predicted RNA-binding protein (virulence factor B family)